MTCSSENWKHIFLVSFISLLRRLGSKITFVGNSHFFRRKLMKEKENVVSQLNDMTETHGSLPVPTNVYTPGSWRNIPPATTKSKKHASQKCSEMLRPSHTWCLMRECALNRASIRPQTEETWDFPERPRYFAATIAMHYAWDRGWHISRGGVAWRVRSGVAYPWRGLTLVLTWHSQQGGGIHGGG